MKTLGLVLGLTLLVGGASMAATATFDVYGGWQTISVPIVPFDAQTNHVFSQLDWDNISPTVMRWNNAGGGGWVTYSYDYDTGVDANFGGVLLGEGYMFSPDQAGKTTITVTGVPDGVPDANGVKTDMWISLPKKGIAIVGVPYAQDIAIDQDSGSPITFTDGTEVKSWPDAVAAQWVGEIGQRYDGLTKRWITAGINYFEEESWKTGAGYIIDVKKDNVAMIIAAPQN